MDRRLAWRGQNSSTWEQKRAEGWAEHHSGALQELFTIGEHFNILAKTSCCSFILRPGVLSAVNVCHVTHCKEINFLFLMFYRLHMHPFIYSFSWKALIKFSAAFKYGHLFTVYHVYEMIPYKQNACLVCISEVNVFWQHWTSTWSFTI